MRPRKSGAELQEALLRVTCIICNVTGVMTKREVTLAADGSRVMTFCSADAPRIKMAHILDIKVIMVSGRDDPANHHRAKDLDVPFICKKDPKIQAAGGLWPYLKKNHHVSPQDVCYIEDDAIGLRDMADAGLAVTATPKDGMQDCLSEGQKPEDVVDMVTDALGGHGVVSEVIRRILMAQDKWEIALDIFR